MARLTASKTVWNFPPISARSRFQLGQYAVEVLRRRCSTQAPRTRGWEIRLACELRPGDDCRHRPAASLQGAARRPGRAGRSSLCTPRRHARSSAVAAYLVTAAVLVLSLVMAHAARDVSAPVF
jgi:hypothetical protein